MKKYIRSVVLICALNGVGVWAEDQCAFKIISPEFGPWPAMSNTRGSFGCVTAGVNSCVKSRDYQTCGRGDSVGWNGYYCYNGPDRHHVETTTGVQWGASVPCPHPRKIPVESQFRPTKVLSKNPCSYYHNP